MHCRFRIEQHPTKDSLDRGKVKAAEWFVEDQRKEGFEYVGRFGFILNPKPFVPVVPVTLDTPKHLTARQMLSGVIQGNKYRANEFAGVQTVPLLGESEYWEYDISAVFVHRTILTERPDPHEEQI